MSEFSVHATCVTVTAKVFLDGAPTFSLLEIETEDRHGTKDLVKIFLTADDAERLTRAVEAFNSVWEIPK